MSPLVQDAPAAKTRRKPRRRTYSKDRVAAPPKAELSVAAAEKEEVLAGFSVERMTWKNVDWIVAVWIIGMHIGALAAPFFFSWSAIGVAVLLHWLTCSIGVCLCFHRCLSHKSFKLRQPSRFLAMLCGVLSGEGTPLRWAATHRVHHGHSDQDGDPHSPLDGTFWSHILWLFVKHDPKHGEMLYRRFVPDLMNDRLMLFFEKTFGLWLVATGAVLYALGGLPWLLWGLCARMVFAYHSTWFVNSATHLWGYRNYKTTDESRNLWWVALFAYGEGWHNNHHAHPRLARAGHRWWEFDMTWWAISLLRKIGQATDVDDRIPVVGAASTEHDL